MVDFAPLKFMDATWLVYNSLAESLRPPARVTVTQWADQHRILPSKGAAEPGPWRTARTPFLAEIMDVLSASHSAKRVVFMKSAQTAGTEAGLNWVGWCMATQKTSLLAVQPTLDMAERWSKQRLASMIEDSPVLRKLIAPARSRDSGNTTLLKEWPGGVLVIAGANSASGLRSMPAKYIFLDEVDAYPLELEGEGDPVKLAEARATTYTRRKVFMVSTPTIASLSRINKEWLQSDKRRYHVPCPHCGHFQYLVWDNLKWLDGQPESAAYCCQECGALIEEHHKSVMLSRGTWIAEYPERETVGFHISGLYTPPGLGLTWRELVMEFEEAQRDPVRMRTFMNVRLGECFEDPHEKLDWETLKNRAQEYELRVAPKGCLLVTAGVDVQGNRLVALTLGHGRNDVKWVLDYVELPGDPSRPEVWAALDAHMAQPIINACGNVLRISSYAVDCGHLYDDVQNYVRQRRSKGVIAVKGASTYGKAVISRPSKADFTWRGKPIKGGAEIWMLGVDTAKHMLFARMASDNKHTPDDHLVRFSNQLPDAFFMGVTAEVFDPAKRKFVKLRRENEPLDTLVYAMAAAMQPSIRVHTWKEPTWARLEQSLEPANGDLFTRPVEPVAAPQPEPEAREEQQAPKPVQKGSFLQNQIKARKRRQGDL